MRRFQHWRRLDEDNNNDAPAPPGWTNTLIAVSLIIQMIIAFAILLAYIFSEKFRHHPGNISVGFALATLSLSIIWLLNLSDDMVNDPASCAWLGFFSQLTETASSFYELGTLYYFYCFFKEIAKPGRRELQEERRDEVPRGEALIDNPLNVSLRGSQISSLLSTADSNLLSELNREIRSQNLEEDLDDDRREAQEHVKKIVKILNLMEETLSQQQRKTDQVVTQNKQLLLYIGATSLTAMQIQGRIHISVVIAAFTFVLIPSLTETLGGNFFGTCSVKWEPHKQTTGIVLTVFGTGLSAILSLVTLAYFWAKKETRDKLKEDYEAARRNGNSNSLDDQEEHYAKHLLYYVLCSTIFGFGLATTNVFADSQSDYSSQFTELFFFLYYFLTAIRGVLLLWLKLAEPATRDALFDTFKKFSKKCKQFFKGQARISHRPLLEAERTLNN